MTEKNTPEHEIRRSGFQTSEFWLSLGALVLSTILPLLIDELGKIVTASPYSAFAPALIAAGYAISRGLVKKSRNDASAVVSVAEAKKPTFDADTIRAFVAQEATRRISDKISPVNHDEPTQRVLDAQTDEITPFEAPAKL